MSRNPSPEQFATLSPGAQEWLLNGDRGCSSNTLFSHATGIDVTGFAGYDHPYDAADFRRCRLLLEAAPEIRQGLRKAAQTSPEWAALANWWDDLCLLHDVENPEWRVRFEPAPQTSSMIRDTLKSVERSTQRKHP